VWLIQREYLKREREREREKRKETSEAKQKLSELRLRRVIFAE
jgi:hypothetical protein